MKEITLSYIRLGKRWGIIWGQGRREWELLQPQFSMSFWGCQVQPHLWKNSPLSECLPPESSFTGLLIPQKKCLKNLWEWLLFSKAAAVTQLGFYLWKTTVNTVVVFFSNVLLQKIIRKEYTISVNYADLKPDVSFHWLLLLFLKTCSCL